MHRPEDAVRDHEDWDGPGAAAAQPAPAAAASAPAPPEVASTSQKAHPLARLAPVAATAAVGVLVLAGLASFGIWDPWEIELADRARRLADGEPAPDVQVGPWLVALGFRLLGVDEWTGRLPIALCAVVAAALAYPLVARFAGLRAGVYAVLITGTSPLFLFNARTMLGEAPVFALQTAIAMSASFALFGARGHRPAGAARWLWLGAALLLAAAATAARGALLGALPPLGAAALVAAFEGKLRPRGADPVGARIAAVLWLAALGLAFAVLQAVVADRAGYSPWLGGSPQGGQPPSFEVVIERAFHAFAPYSVLLPVALARLALPRGPARRDADGGDASDDERRLGMLCLLWIALGYAALTLFLSRYGDKAAAFPVVAMAAAVALFLRDVERSRESQIPIAMAAALLAGLIARDYALYPHGPVHGMPLADFSVPEVFNPKRTWGALIAVFAAAAVLGLGAYTGESARRLDLRAPYRLIGVQWRRGAGFKAWLVLFALLVVGLELFGVLAFAAPEAARLTTQAVKWGRRLAFVPLALPLAIAATQLVLHLHVKLRELRTLPVLAAGLAVGGYAAFGFMPALSSHFSPREVYETYNELARPDEPLIEYKVGTRAAHYYAKGEARDVDTLGELMDVLLEPKRAWAVFPAEDLAPIDRMFRAKTDKHLFVADAQNAKVTLATNQPIAGRRDQSFLTEFVRRSPPERIQHRVDANFDDKILLLGYDLKLPHGDHVAAGESFEITWYFKALRSVPGSYRVFVHIDSNALRIHGDHDPVDGRYPVRLWDEGDVIADRQRIEVPGNYGAGAYTIYMGFYSGETRLTVKEGPRDEVNRVRAGVLRIR